MGREALPLGTWGSVSTRVVSRDRAGRPRKFEARAWYRDLDGRTRPVTKWGNSKTDAENKLRTALKTRQRTGQTNGLQSSDRVSTAVELFLVEVRDLIEQDVLAPNTYQ